MALTRDDLIPPAGPAPTPGIQPAESQASSTSPARGRPRSSPPSRAT